MRLNKRLAATAMAALMASSMLVGCGSDSGSATQAGTSAAGGSESVRKAETTPPSHLCLLTILQCAEK